MTEMISMNKYNHKTKVIRRKDMYEKIKLFIKLDERIINNEGQLFRFSYLNCPCKRTRAVGVEEYCNKEGVLLKQNEFELYAVYRYINHLHSQIRLYCDKIHIDILINIIGVKNTIEILKYWINKNIAVTEKMKLVVSELEKQKIQGVKGE